MVDRVASEGDRGRSSWLCCNSNIVLAGRLDSSLRPGQLRVCNEEQNQETRPDPAKTMENRHRSPGLIG